MKTIFMIIDYVKLHNYVPVIHVNMVFIIWRPTESIYHHKV